MNETPKRRSLITSAAVRAQKGNISDMTLSRWLRNPTLCFPQPVIINGRRYWYEDEVAVWVPPSKTGAAV